MTDQQKLEQQLRQIAKELKLNHHCSNSQIINEVRDVLLESDEDDEEEWDQDHAYDHSIGFGDSWLDNEEWDQDGSHDDRSDRFADEFYADNDW